MAVLRPCPLSTKAFTYSLNDRMFVAELSTLGDPKLGRVYDDACDEGLTLISHVTGGEIVFAVTHEERRDGDLLYIDLSPVHGDVDCTVRLYND